MITFHFLIIAYLSNPLFISDKEVNLITVINTLFLHNRLLCQHINTIATQFYVRNPFLNTISLYQSNTLRILILAPKLFWILSDWFLMGNFLTNTKDYGDMYLGWFSADSSIGFKSTFDFGLWNPGWPLIFHVISIWNLVTWTSSIHFLVCLDFS